MSPPVRARRQRDFRELGMCAARLVVSIKTTSAALSHICDMLGRGDLTLDTSAVNRVHTEISHMLTELDLDDRGAVKNQECLDLATGRPRDDLSHLDNRRGKRKDDTNGDTT